MNLILSNNYFFHLKNWLKHLLITILIFLIKKKIGEFFLEISTYNMANLSNHNENAIFAGLFSRNHISMRNNLGSEPCSADFMDR